MVLKSLPQERQHGKEERVFAPYPLWTSACRLTQVCELKYVPGNMGQIHHPGRTFVALQWKFLISSTSVYTNDIDMWIILNLCILSTSLFVFCSLDDKTLDVRDCG